MMETIPVHITVTLLQSLVNYDSVYTFIRMFTYIEIKESHVETLICMVACTNKDADAAPAKPPHGSCGFPNSPTTKSSNTSISSIFLATVTYFVSDDSDRVLRRPVSYKITTYPRRNGGSLRAHGRPGSLWRIRGGTELTTTTLHKYTTPEATIANTCSYFLE